MILHSEIARPAEYCQPAIAGFDIFTIPLKVVINNELERLILGYGGHAEVIAPPEFRTRIAESVKIAALHYNIDSAANGCPTSK